MTTKPPNTGPDLMLEDLRAHIAADRLPSAATLELWQSWLENPFPSVVELEPFIGKRWVVARRTPRITAKYGPEVRCLSQQAFSKAQRAALLARRAEAS